MKSTKIFNIFLVLVILTGSLIRFDLQDRPMQFNEGIFAYFADNMLNHNMKYLDTYDSKPPGIYYFFMFFMKIFGNNPTAFHLVTVISDVIIIIFIYLIGLKLFNKNVALLASAIYSCSYLAFTVSKGGFLEPPMMVFTLISLYFYLSFFERNNSLYLFISGIFLMLSFNIKQPAIIMLLTYFAYLYFLFINKKDDVIQLLKRSMLIISGFVLSFLPILSYIIISNKLNKYIFSVYYSSISYGPIFSTKMYSIFLYFWEVMPVFLILFIISFFVIFNRNKTIFLYFWILPIIFFYTVTTDFQPHYLIQVLPVMVLFVSFFLNKIRSHLKLFFTLVIIIHSSIFIYSEVYYFHDYKKDNTVNDYFSRMKYPNVLRASYMIGYFREQDQISRFIIQNTNSTDEITTPLPAYSYLTGKTSNYRFLWINPMVSRVTNTSDFPDYASRSKYFIYEIWQEDQGHISKKFISCIKKNWRLVREVSTWYAFVYENTNKTICSNVW